jgi:hypothetical protein
MNAMNARCRDNGQGDGSLVPLADYVKRFGAGGVGKRYIRWGMRRGVYTVMLTR